MEIEIEERLKEFYTKAVNLRNSNSLDRVFIDEALKISGPSGVGKSTIIRTWAEKKKNKINFVELSCAEIKSDNGGMFTADEVEKLERENTIIFFDDYDLATDETKRQIDRLVTTRMVTCKGSGGERDLPYVLFVILAETVPARKR